MQPYVTDMSIFQLSESLWALGTLFRTSAADRGGVGREVREKREMKNMRGGNEDRKDVKRFEEGFIEEEDVFTEASIVAHLYLRSFHAQAILPSLSTDDGGSDKELQLQPLLSTRQLGKFFLGKSSFIALIEDIATILVVSCFMWSGILIDLMSFYHALYYHQHSI